jgi:uncharacterized protein (TIGR03435 family)
MRSALLAIGVFFLCFAASFGQTAEPKLNFEVATIRPYIQPQPGPGGRGGIFIGGGGGPGTSDPGRITRSGVTLRDLMMNAYDVKRYQVSGPSWTESDRYDIVAKVPAGATKEQVKVMWQNLLADRFGVVFHRESKEFQVQELTVGKGGSKLKPTELDLSAPVQAPPPGPIGPPTPPKMDANGFPQLDRPGLLVMISPGPSGTPIGHMVARAQAVSDFANLLGNQLNSPIVDKTGLTGKFDFNLEYSVDPGTLPPPPPGAPPPSPTDNASDPGSNLAAAMQQQLGLKLSGAKAKLDVLVIDKAEKTPSEN